jgi:hypothetical protein
MITGAHAILYSTNSDADRAFLRDVLGFQSVDAGEGWLIFALPPSEVAVHPSDGTITQNHAGHDMLGVVLYLMCDDVRDAVTSLGFKNVTCAPVETAAWGLYTVVRLPSGGSIGLYQPTHPTAVAAAH